jgi:hypothetical protein
MPPLNDLTAARDCAGARWVTVAQSRGIATATKNTHATAHVVSLRCTSPKLALLGPRAMSDLSPQSGQKRTLS